MGSVELNEASLLEAIKDSNGNLNIQNLNRFFTSMDKKGMVSGYIVMGETARVSVIDDEVLNRIEEVENDKQI